MKNIIRPENFINSSPVKIQISVYFSKMKFRNIAYNVKEKKFVNVFTSLLC